MSCKDYSVRSQNLLLLRKGRGIVWHEVDNRGMGAGVEIELTGILRVIGTVVLVTAVFFYTAGAMEFLATIGIRVTATATAASTIVGFVKSLVSG